MKGTLKKILALILLALFLTPTVVKVEHHHEHFVCSAKNEKHLHLYRDKCPVCSFEFSIFSFSGDKEAVTRTQYSDAWLNTYQPADFPVFLNFSFSLRAPPLKA